jgi:hypothetical protein
LSAVALGECARDVLHHARPRLRFKESSLLTARIRRLRNAVLQQNLWVKKG